MLYNGLNTIIALKAVPHVINRRALAGEKPCINLCLFGFVDLCLFEFVGFPLPLGVWEGLRFMIELLPGLFSYHF